MTFKRVERVGTYYPEGHFEKNIAKARINEKVTKQFKETPHKKPFTNPQSKSGKSQEEPGKKVCVPGVHCIQYLPVKCGAVYEPGGWWL